MPSAAADLLEPQAQESLSAAYALNPEHRQLGELLNLLSAAQNQGIDEAVDQWTAQAPAQETLADWMAILGRQGGW